MVSSTFPKQLFAAIRHEKPQIRVSRIVVESAAMDAAGVYARLATRPEGLTADEAAARLATHGPNTLAKDQQARIGKLLWHAAINPLVVLLAVLATISFATGDTPADHHVADEWLTLLCYVVLTQLVRRYRLIHLALVSKPPLWVSKIDFFACLWHGPSAACWAHRLDHSSDAAGLTVRSDRPGASPSDTCQ